MANWVEWIVNEVVHEAPQLVLLVLAFAFTTGVFMALFMGFEFIYRRMAGGRDLLNTFFHRDVTALDQMVDEIDALQRQRDEQLAKRPSALGSTSASSTLSGDDDVEFNRLQRDADMEQTIARGKLLWAARREHLLRKQQLLRVSTCVCVALLIFWRMGALDSRWCALSTTHRQLVHSLLAHTTAVLDASGLEYWVDGPTLLAAYRDNTLSEWDDRLVLATWKENQPKVWNTLRPALEQRGRYYLEKYRAPVVPVANPPAFRLHYASLQRHINRLPYLDIYLYSREGSPDNDNSELETPQVKESAVQPLRNVTLDGASSSSSLPLASYRVPLPHDVHTFLARLLGDAFDARAIDEAHHRSVSLSSGGGPRDHADGLHGYKALTCQIYRDQGNNLALFALAGTIIYFVLVIYALPRVSFNERWRF